MQKDAIVTVHLSILHQFNVPRDCLTSGYGRDLSVTKIGQFKTLPALSVSSAWKRCIHAHFSNVFCINFIFPKLK